jgi:hypothetical protein
MVINSPEVYLEIKRQRPHAEVGHKNIISFSYKNYLDRICKKGKNSYKQIYSVTLCNFWHKS